MTTQVTPCLVLAILLFLVGASLVFVAGTIKLAFLGRLRESLAIMCIAIGSLVFGYFSINRRPCRRD